MKLPPFSLRDLMVRQKGLFVLGILVVGLIFFFSGRSNSSLEDERVTVQKRTLQESTLITGRVKSANDISMAFEQAGRISFVGKRAGMKVSPGEVLVSIDSGQIRARLLQAEAKLQELKRGSRPEEIAVKEATLEQSTQDLNSAYENVSDIVADAYRKGEEAVRSKTSSLFSGNSTIGYRSTVTNACDTQGVNDSVALRQKAEVELFSWQKENVSLTTLSREDLKEALERSYQRSILFRDFLEKTDSLLKGSCLLADTSYDSERADMASGKNAVAEAIASLNTKRGSINAYQATVAKTQADLDLLLAGSSFEETSLQEAKVLEEKEALRKYSLVSPVFGSVSKAEVEVGEIVSANTEIVRVISSGVFSVESNVSETSIGKIKIGDQATITLDAYGPGVVFTGAVTSLDPAAVIDNNVPTYKVKVSFSGVDERIKAGMTANVSVNTKKKEGVLSVPARALTYVEGKETIRILKEGKEISTVVTLGIRGESGYVEIVSGVSEGDMILIKTSEQK